MQNNPISEVAMLVVAGLLIIVGAVLLYLNTITLDSAFVLWGLAGSLLGINLAYKVPSPTQQAQQNAQQARADAQQQNVQQLLSQALAVLPVFASLLHSHTPAPQVAMSAHPVQGYAASNSTNAAAVPQAPVAPPQPQQTTVPVQPAVQSSQPVAPVSVPTATLQPQVAPVVPQRDDFSQSALMRAVGQFPPTQQ